MNVYTYLYTYILQTAAFIMHLCLYIFSDTTVITLSGFPVTTRTIIFPFFGSENVKLRLHFLLKFMGPFCIQCYVYLQFFYTPPKLTCFRWGFHRLTYWGWIFHVFLLAGRGSFPLKLQRIFNKKTTQRDMWAQPSETNQQSHPDSFWLVVEPTHLKNISQNGNLPQIGVNIKNIWNHHLGFSVSLPTSPKIPPPKKNTRF